MLSIPRLFSSALLLTLLHQAAGVRPAATAKRRSTDDLDLGLSALDELTEAGTRAGTAASYTVKETFQRFAQGLGITDTPSQTCMWKKRPGDTEYTCMGNAAYLFNHGAFKKMKKNPGLREAIEKIYECYEVSEHDCETTESCSWDTVEKRCSISDGEKDALVVAMGKMLGLVENCGAVGDLMTAKTELEDKCAEGQETGRCPSEKQGCGNLSQWIPNAKATACTLQDRCVPMRAPFACKNQKAREKCDDEADKSIIQDDFPENDTRRIIKEPELRDKTMHEARVACLKREGCPDLAEFTQKRWEASLQCAGIKSDLKACLQNPNCFGISVEKDGKPESFCVQDDVSTYHSIAETTCGLKPLFTLHLTCKKFTRDECSGDCHWTTKASCQHATDKVAPRVGQYGGCAPKISVWLSQFAQMSRKPEVTALIAPVQALEGCREQKEKQTCVQVEAVPEEKKDKKRAWGDWFKSGSRKSNSVHSVISAFSLGVGAALANFPSA